MNIIRQWWLANPDLWFGSSESNDNEITLKFENLFDKEYEEGYLIDNIEEGIGYIILHDQIARHVRRARKYPEQYVLDKLEKILEFVKKFYQVNKSNLFGYDFCFVLLPLRHTGNFDLQVFVINETWNKLLEYHPDTSDINEKELIKIYRNYLKASYERASNGKTYINCTDNFIDIHSNIENFINTYSDILDVSCHNYITNHNINEKSKYYDKVIKEFKLIKNNLTPQIILSISGGVDSMILSWILLVNNINFVMVHINYSNRGETCVKEKKMLIEWANYINKELYIRDIDEINRPTCMKWDLRNLYESYTRDARYQSYIDVAKQNGWEDNSWGVILGHNHDDCIENILTNIVNKNKYENLYGMEFKSFVNFKSSQLCFLRPMLTITKQEIYNFAHESNIPYLFDSTPKWSQRGQIRDIIRPALINWNRTSIEGLDELVRVSSDSLECVDMLVDTWISKLIWFNELNVIDKIKSCIEKKSVDKDFRVIKIKLEELRPNKIFWSRLLNKIFLSNINSKCIDDFLCRITGFKNKFEKLQPKLFAQIQMGKLYFDNQTKEKIKKIYYWKTLDNLVIIGFDIDELN